MALNFPLACNFFQPNHTKNFSLRIQICSSQTVALNFQLACKVFQPCEILIQVFVFPFLVHTLCYFELLAHSGMKSQKEETRLEQALSIFHTSDGKVDHSWATFENSANLTHWTSARHAWVMQTLTCCEPSKNTSVSFFLQSLDSVSFTLARSFRHPRIINSPLQTHTPKTS